jgi:hypothetical protein
MESKEVHVYEGIAAMAMQFGRNDGTTPYRLTSR